MKQILVAILLLELTQTPMSLASEISQISWATATKGGGFQLFGEHMAEVINSTDSRLNIEVLATKGSRHNLELLEAGEVDVGQVEGNAARIALDGIGRQAANLRILSVMYPNPGMFVVRGDSEYQSIEDLKGQPIAFGTKASGLRILVNDVLDGLGLDPAKDFQQIILEKAAEGPKLVLEGQAEALWGAGIGWPGFVKVANGPAGGRFISPSPDEIQQILEKHPHLQRMTVPAGTYKGQDKDIHSIGLWSLILVRPDLDEETVYRLARAIHRGHDALVRRLPQGRYTQAANTVSYVPAEQLHPGAAKYYREIGLLAAPVAENPWSDRHPRRFGQERSPAWFFCAFCEVSKMATTAVDDIHGKQPSPQQLPPIQDDAPYSWQSANQTHTEDNNAKTVGNRKSVEIAVFPVLGAGQRSRQYEALITEVVHDHAALDLHTKTGLFIATLCIDICARAPTVLDEIVQRRLIGKQEDHLVKLDSATDVQATRPHLYVGELSRRLIDATPEPVPVVIRKENLRVSRTAYPAAA